MTASFFFAYSLLYGAHPSTAQALLETSEYSGSLPENHMPISEIPLAGGSNSS